ncbi:MAG TPA: VWA domain-containing protein [Bryobacteraceae bacterium]|jgi:VWFA-related protein
MKAIRILAALSACVFAFVLFSRAQGPILGGGSETVAHPKTQPGSSTTTNNPAPDVSAPAEPVQPKIPSEYGRNKNVPAPVATYSAQANAVTVDIAVEDAKGHFIPKIGKEYFRVSEDNVPQKIDSFSIGEAPMTIAMVVEFSNRFQSFYSYTWFQTLQAAYGFAQMLKPEDYLAIVAYDLKPEMLTDFTTDRGQINEALSRLRFPGFSEANLYDALTDTIERMQPVEGRKAILLLSSGVDTFSGQTFDQARRKIQEGGVPIYAVGLMQSIRDMAEASGQLRGMQDMTFLQADSQMKTFATESGGMAFFPHFVTEFPEIFRNMATNLRSRYLITYTPSNQARDGKYRKIKVELIDPSNNLPMPMVDDKHKPIKYSIYAKAGYTAPRPVD